MSNYLQCFITSWTESPRIEWHLYCNKSASSLRSSPIRRSIASTTRAGCVRCGASGLFGVPVGRCVTPILFPVWIEFKYFEGCSILPNHRIQNNTRGVRMQLYTAALLISHGNTHVVHQPEHFSGCSLLLKYRVWNYIFDICKGWCIAAPLIWHMLR